MNGADVLKQLPKLRDVLRRMRSDPTLPHLIELPTGEVIDVLDGETDRFLDELEFFARRDVTRSRKKKNGY